MNRYMRIRALMATKLQSKTGWGRNELMSALDEVLIQVADEEVSNLQDRLEGFDATVPPSGGDGVPF